MDVLLIAALVLMTLFTVIIIIGIQIEIIMGKCTRRKLLKEHAVPDNLSASLSDRQLTALRKIYGKRFKDNKVYRLNGPLYEGKQTRFFNSDTLAINGIRIETWHLPYSPITITKSEEFYHGEFNASEILSKCKEKSSVYTEGVIYKDCFYITKINNFDMLDELTEHFTKPQHVSDIYMLGMFAIFPIAGWGINWFIVALDASAGSFFAVPCIIGLLIFSLRMTYLLTRVYTVEGVFCPLSDRRYSIQDKYRFGDDDDDTEEDVEDNCVVGTIDGAFIKSQYPLECGKYYQLLVAPEPLSQSYFFDVKKINGEKYTDEEDACPELFLLVVLFGLIFSLQFLFSAQSAYQEDAKPYYEHNLEKFDTPKLSQYVVTDKQLEKTEIGDLLQITELYYSHVNQQFLLFRDDAGSVNAAFKRYCTSGQYHQAVNFARKYMDIRRTIFMLNGIGVENYSYASVTRPRNDVLNDDVCDTRGDLLRYVGCPGCEKINTKNWQLIVTGIDRDKNIFYVTNDLDVYYYAVNKDHYLIAIVNMIASVIYLFLGLVFVWMKRRIRKINDSPDILWVK